MAHWLRRTVLVIIGVVVAALSGATSAAAGGPTSVLLSAPSIPKVTAAGYEDKTYEQLVQLIQTTDAVGKHEPPGSGHDSGSLIRATWLIHDMSIWRLDLIYPDAPGGLWIATTLAGGDGAMPEQPLWHRSQDPAQLLNVLRDLGLLGGDRGSGGPTNPSWNAEPPPAAQPTEQPVRTVMAEPDTLTGWRWSIPGFLLGAVIAIVAVRLWPRPRDWQLTDAE
ncbi:MAG TPA: hypothetical protein VFT31_14710 [Kribbella sp.]|nr:hypothetical protein [Kribbella sp.]